MSPGTYEVLEDELEENIESMDLEDAFKYLLDEPCHDMEDELPFK